VNCHHLWRLLVRGSSRHASSLYKQKHPVLPLWVSSTQKDMHISKLAAFSVLVFVFLTDHMDEGVSIQKIIPMLSGYAESEIRSVIMSCMEEGNIYSTIDENHFKCAV
jgi:hypothetical protein